MTKARLHAISAPQAHTWLIVQPSPKLGLALMPDEAVILKWWLGIIISNNCIRYKINILSKKASGIYSRNTCIGFDAGVIYKK